MKFGIVWPNRGFYSLLFCLDYYYSQHIFKGLVLNPIGTQRLRKEFRGGNINLVKLHKNWNVAVYLSKKLKQKERKRKHKHKQEQSLRSVIKLKKSLSTRLQ